MDKIMFIYKDFLIKAECDDLNTKIENSYQVKSFKDMKYILEHIRKILKNENYAVNLMPLFRQIVEWRAHNMLYRLHIKREQTKSVDINIDEYSYRIIAYFILSLLYW